MSQKLDERLRCIALAHLKNGEKPKDVAEKLDIAYSAAVKLKKELAEAERQNNLTTLFKLDQAALTSLIELVKDVDLGDSVDALNMMPALEGELETLKDSVNGVQQLDVEFQEAASALTKRINIIGSTATSPETIVMLAKALSDLQNSFFAKGTNVQVNNYSGFERYLDD